MNQNSNHPATSDHEDIAISTRQIIGDSPIMVNEIFAGCMYTAIYGTLDSIRIKGLSDTILNISSQSDTDIIIIDLSNIDIIDSLIASHIIKLNKTLQLVGVEVIFCGIKPVVAQSMVSTGVLMDNITVLKNLKRALTEVYRMKGYHLVRVDS